VAAFVTAERGTARGHVVAFDLDLSLVDLRAQYKPSVCPDSNSQDDAAARSDD
jgi:hypothetical protein